MDCFSSFQFCILLLICRNRSWIDRLLLLHTHRLLLGLSWRSWWRVLWCIWNFFWSSQLFSRIYSTPNRMFITESNKLKVTKKYGFWEDFVSNENDVLFCNVWLQDLIKSSWQYNINNCLHVKLLSESVIYRINYKWFFILVDT